MDPTPGQDRVHHRRRRQHRRGHGAAVRRRGRARGGERRRRRRARRAGRRSSATTRPPPSVADVTDSAQVRARRGAGGRSASAGSTSRSPTRASSARSRRVVDYPEDVFERVLAVNVRGPFHVAKHALTAMRDGGSLILNSSVVGLTSDPGICAYATSKHALVGLMRTAAKEVAPRGIRVNTIHPGPVDNAFQHRIETVATGEDAAAGGGDLRVDDPARPPRARPRRSPAPCCSWRATRRRSSRGRRSRSMAG